MCSNKIELSAIECGLHAPIQLAAQGVNERVAKRLHHLDGVRRFANDDRCVDR